MKLRSELEQNPEKEAELERLREELVAATDTARKLFGAMSVEQQQESSSTDEMTHQKVDPTLELRLRLVQMDMELGDVEEKLKKAKHEGMEMELQLEQKDLMNARLLDDIQV